MVKGLHDIKTMFHEPPKEKRGSSLTRGILGVDLDQKRPLRIPKKREEITHPRTWVFSTKPKFTRYQRASGKGLSIERAKEPPADVHETMDNLVVMAKIPGASREDIHCDVKGDILSIHAVAHDQWGEEIYEGNSPALCCEGE